MFADRPMTSATGAITLPRIAPSLFAHCPVRMPCILPRKALETGRTPLLTTRMVRFVSFFRSPKNFCSRFISGVLTMVEMVFFFPGKGFTRASNIKNQSWMGL